MASSRRRVLASWCLVALGLLSIAAPNSRAATTDSAVAAPTPSAHPLEGATVQGTVRDAESAEPIAGAVLTMAESDRAALTDSAGHYEIRGISPGPHHIAVRLIGYAPRTLDALVPSSGHLTIDIGLHARPFPMATVGVRARVQVRGLGGPDSARTFDRESSIAAVRQYPMVTEPDVFQGLGGGDVVLQAETPAGLRVRGGEADHVGYLLDGIRVFSPFHAAGLASAWNPDALARMRLTSSGDPACPCRTLDGAVEGLTLTPGDRQRIQGSVSSTQSRISFDGPAGPSGARYLVSLRAGFAGLLAGKRESSHLKGDTYDWLAKWEMRAFAGQLRLLGYDSQNEIESSAISGTEIVPGEPTPKNTFAWRSRSWGAEWQRPTGGGAVRVLAWSALSDAGSGLKAESETIQLNAARRDLGTFADFRKRTPRGSIAAGLGLDRAGTTYRVEDDSTDAVLADLNGQNRVATAFAEVGRWIVHRVELDAAATLELRKDQARTTPRMLLRWHPSERFTISGRYAQAHQYAQSLRNQESVVGSIFPPDLDGVAGSRLRSGGASAAIPIARSTQTVIAAEFRPAPGVRASAEGYARDADRILLVAPGSGEPFSLGTFALGSGRARGVSVDAAMSTARAGVVVSYGYQDVRLDYGDSSYVPQHGTRHLFQGGVIVYPKATFSLRIGLEAAWGRRTTIADGVFEWEACNLLDRGCEFAGSPHYRGETLGATAVPAYYRVDAGARKHWHFSFGGRDVSVAAFLAATNLLGRENVLTYARDPGTGAVTAITMRPRSPLVGGVEWTF